MKVSVVIPNYNGKALLAKNLSKILSAVDSAEVIIVDDGSTDESVDFLKQNFPKVRVIEQSKNRGFSSTVNVGVKEASGDLVLLLNSDTVPHKGFLKPLTEHFKDENVFAVGCMDESIEGKNMVKRGRGIGAFVRGFLMHKRGEVDKTTTLWVSGGSSMFRTSLWRKLGGMDEIYNPFYWEDIDLSYRAQKAGYQVLFESGSVVEHYHEEGAIKRTFSDFEIKKIAYRNQFLFVWNTISDSNLLIQHLLWLPYHKLKALLRGDIAFFAGLWSALIQLPQVVKSRRKSSSLWKITDREVLAPFYEEYL